MNNELTNFALEIKEAWEIINAKSFPKIQSLVENFAKNEAVQKSLREGSSNLLNGVELYRDKENGFVLIAYAEIRETYRVPHNHGNGWVVYAVVSGEVEMGNYINLIGTTGSSKLVLMNTQNMEAGNCNIYYPGEIHDTRCMSEHAIILRLTSCDLKEEDRLGRMLRFRN